METEFIYWRHLTPAGIRVEEITGAEDRSAAVWRQMAMQVFGENGEADYRDVGHYDSGAPFLFHEPERISITHTGHFLAVASLPKTPDETFTGFSPRTALGVDAERLDREQTLRVREKFLSERELAMIPADDLEANIKGWTAKEALYKAALTPGIDFRESLRILELPPFGEPVALKGKPAPVFGRAEIEFPTAEEGESRVESMLLYAYESEGCCVMLAFSPETVRYKVR